MGRVRLSTLLWRWVLAPRTTWQARRLAADFGVGIDAHTAWTMALLALHPDERVYAMHHLDPVKDTCMTSDFGNGLVTKEQAFIDARRVLDMARERRDRDRARGVLPPQVEFMLRRLEYKQLAQPELHDTDADAVLLHIAGQWHSHTTPSTSLRQLTKATGLGITALRDALAHLTAVSEVQLSGGNPAMPVDVLGVPEPAGFKVHADWHLINHRRPRPEVAKRPLSNV